MQDAARAELPEKLRVVGVLGRGAMGVVLDAVDTSLDRPVAVKVVSGPAIGTTDAQRLLREARASAALTSPHVVRVFEIGELPSGGFYVVMERLRGETLEERLAREGRLPIADVLAVAREALDALAEAHRLGLVHRDVKPGNLFLAEEAGQRVVKVLDFGLVRDTRGDAVLTRTGEGVGSPAYTAPEQIRSAKDVDARADVWSFGVTLYELLAGSLPFHAESVAGVLTRVLTRDPAPITSLRPDTPPELAAVVMRCLAKDPAGRFGDAGALARALFPEPEPRERGPIALATTVYATSPAPPRAPRIDPRPAPPPATPSTARWIFPVAAALTVAVGLTSLVVIALSRRRTPPPTSRTPIERAEDRTPAPSPILERTPTSSAQPVATAAATPKNCVCRSLDHSIVCSRGVSCRCLTRAGAYAHQRLRLCRSSPELPCDLVFAATGNQQCTGFAAPGELDSPKWSRERMQGNIVCDDRCLPDEPRISAPPGSVCWGTNRFGDQVRGHVVCTP